MTPKALSREIKFRAWNDSKKDWEGNFSISRIGSFLRLGISQSTEGIHVMQYTGLLDKNGKEIYENDYLQWGDGVEIMWVFWDSGKYILQNISSGDIIDCNENTTSVREIIGNRYESPREHKAMASDL